MMARTDKIQVWANCRLVEAGQASPFLTVNGYLFSATSNEEQTQMALEFARFATSG